jgi:hypothetical protein
MLFPLGEFVSTPAALEALARNGQTPIEFLDRHKDGDWGDISDEDKNENDLAVEWSFRILSAYHLNDGTEIWLITHADRSATGCLLPHED